MNAEAMPYRQIELLDKRFDSAIGNSTSASRKSKAKSKANGFLYCGDCIGFMNKMTRESVKVIVTSPPYNIKNSTGNGLKDGRGGKWKNA
ncbi:MAG: hypothetical protein AAF418_04820, partial [Pseudomonadota bacterium]